jgi:hypothetical protein
VAVELRVRGWACVAEGLGMRATARGFAVDPHTVLQWLVEAAEHLQAFSAFFLCDVPGRQLQLDALYAVRRGVKEGAISAEKALQRLEHSRHWVWPAIDPVSTWLLGIEADHYPYRFSKRLATRQPSTSNVKSRRPRHKVRTPGIPSL